MYTIFNIITLGGFMHTISCDVCKKKMDNPKPDRDFYYISRFGICEPCKDSLDSQIRQTIRNKEPFATDWYEKYVNDSLEKAVQKGKI
jgi:hypothetical protein